MVGNKRYVSEYMEGVWGHATALTSSVERHNFPPPELSGKFTSYITSHKNTLKERLESIRDVINSPDAVAARHVAKIHRCLTRRIDPKEFDGDVTAVVSVVWVAWFRFNELKECFQHQEVPDLTQMFGSVSCGLFNKYMEWAGWENRKYFMDRKARAWRAWDAIMPLVWKSQIWLEFSQMNIPLPPRIQKVYLLLYLRLSEPYSLNEESGKLSSNGTWYGYHWTDRRPFMPMTRLDINCGEVQEQNQTDLTGKGLSIHSLRWDLDGTLHSAQNGLGTIDRDVLAGTIQCSGTTGLFWFKKVPTSPGVPQLKYEELWSLDCDVDEMKRKCEKLTNIYRAAELIYKNQGGLLDDDAEKDEYSAVKVNFSFEDIPELHGLYHWWYDRADDLQPRDYYCDGCGDTIRRPRIICLDCVSTDWPERTVDFCSKVECIACASLPERKDQAQFSRNFSREVYTESSLAAPSRDPFTGAEGGECLDPMAQIPLDAGDTSPGPSTGAEGDQPLDPMSQIPLDARDTNPDPSTGAEDGEPRDPMPQIPLDAGDTSLGPECKICHERIVVPCWHCIGCDDSWVCDPCEKTIDGLSPWNFHARFREELPIENTNNDDSFWDFYWPRPGAHHNVLHPLVRVVAEGPEPDKSESPVPLPIQQ
ncbi:hypothetical protein B0H17DRAFT_1181532 [Mycena rosella]|uniref:ZZ-type domain-containing protein n=1 Tax=Mycena rosella TaxID=1033263 RepID=A0AAD7GFB1_MYCRO|nr:hypothetical protein B0H17DRAFT_1181532 [Mycena rosella]